MTLDEQGLRHIIRWIQGALGEKVDAQDGLGLSRNSFEDGYKQILDAAYAGGQKGLVPEGNGAPPGSFLRADGSWAMAPDTQGDWEERDAGSPAFIANKPFGIATFEVVPLQTVVSDAAGTSVLAADAGAMPEDGEIQVTFDGTDYIVLSEATYDSSGMLLGITAGNRYFVTGNLADSTGEPFCFKSDGTTLTMVSDTMHEHTVSACASITKVLNPEAIGLEEMDPITDTEIDMLFAQAADNG